MSSCVSEGLGYPRAIASSRVAGKADIIGGSVALSRGAQENSTMLQELTEVQPDGADTRCNGSSRHSLTVRLARLSCASAKSPVMRDCNRKENERTLTAIT